MHLQPRLDLGRFSPNRCHPDFPPREGTKARKPTAAVGQAGLFQNAPEFGDVARVPKDTLWKSIPARTGSVPNSRQKKNHQAESTHSLRLQEQGWKSPRQLDSRPPKKKKKKGISTLLIKM